MRRYVFRDGKVTVASTVRSLSSARFETDMQVLILLPPQSNIESNSTSVEKVDKHDRKTG
jgi:hypothetical protein